MKQRLFAAVVAALLLALAGCTPEESDPVSPSSSSATEPSASQVEPASEEVSEPLEEIPSVPEVTSSMPEPPSTAEPGSEEDTGKLPPDNDPVPMDTGKTAPAPGIDLGEEAELASVAAESLRTTLAKTLSPESYSYIGPYEYTVPGQLVIGVVDEQVVREAVASCPDASLLTIEYRPAEVSLAQKQSLIEAIEELSIPDNADVRFDDPLEETLSVTLIFKDSDQADVFQKEIERLAAEQDFPEKLLRVSFGQWYDESQKLRPD